MTVSPGWVRCNDCVWAPSGWLRLQINPAMRKSLFIGVSCKQTESLICCQTAHFTSWMAIRAWTCHLSVCTEKFTHTSRTWNKTRSGVLKSSWIMSLFERFKLWFLDFFARLWTEQCNIGFTAPACGYFNLYNFKMFACFSFFLDTLLLLFVLEDF